MTEREAWYAKLESAPEDSGLRMIFADWLDDRGEVEMAAGYRALGRCERVPTPSPISGWCWNLWHSLPKEPSFLPTPWDTAIQPYTYAAATLREIEDRAALAWSRLTPEQQAVAVGRLIPSPALA